jgi:hypothetical protein
MKKLLLKKLQSLTAILVLNTLPAGLLQASVGYEAEVSQARILSDDRKNALKKASQEDPLKQLYLENSLAYIQKQTGKTLSYQHQFALAIIEEAYQDDLDTLFDHYENELNHAFTLNDQAQIENTKRWVEGEMLRLKEMRSAKISEFSQQFGIS